MKVKREEENPLLTMISVKPWDDPWSQDVVVFQYKRDAKTNEPINRVQVRYGSQPVSAEVAFQFAQAILRAVDIAKRLEEEGAIILEGEEAPSTD